MQIILRKLQRSISSMDMKILSKRFTFSLFVSSIAVGTAIADKNFLANESLFSRLAAYTGVFLAVFVPVYLILTFFYAIGRFLARTESTQTNVESIASAERQIAVQTEVLIREFQSRISKEVDNSVNRLSIQADVLIKNEISNKIDTKIGENLVSILGEKLSEQTNETNKLAILRQESGDRFVQMRNRALEYAASAEKQSQYFRKLAIVFSSSGLVILGILLVFSQTHYLIFNTNVNEMTWKSMVARFGTAYTFVVLCEFLAIVMFRYQSRALEQMRYFSNEATNIDARHIAYMSAIQYMDKAKMSRLIDRLDSTERNFIINKNQKTIEIANNEIDLGNIEKLKSAIQQIASKHTVK